MEAQWEESLRQLASEIASFQDAPTQAGRTTGEAGGGRHFERVVADGFVRFGELLSRFIPSLEVLAVKECSNSEVRYDAFAIRNEAFSRVLVFHVPGFVDTDFTRFLQGNSIFGKEVCVEGRFLKRKFQVKEWYDPRLGELEERGWIPTAHEDYPFSGDRYPGIYQGKTTLFDGVIAFFEGEVLKEKTLLEIKSLKSSNGRDIDGNAHERFAYQNLDYLEIAALYPRTTLLLLTNDAILRFRNKYHTGLGIHALRLSHAFCWYRFHMVSSVEQYVRLFQSWRMWLEGK